ncbi:MAG: NfeD family protein [Desulfovermiculus sp.]|nr:NfeD family protein [Desulfovermiculus sp.]
MIKTGWSRRAVITYILLQLPGILLVGLALLVIHAQFDLPARVGWLIFSLWVVKDATLFFFLWPAYDHQSRDVYSLVGHKALAATDIGPQGRVRLHGQTWPAQAESPSSPIPAGTWVEVLDRKGLVLIVRALPSTRMK